MPTTYLHVLEETVKTRRIAKTSATFKERLDAVIVPVTHVGKAFNLSPTLHRFYVNSENYVKQKKWLGTRYSAGEMVNKRSTVKAILDKVQVCRGETKSSIVIESYVDARMDLLRELLKLNDSNDRDSAIIEASNLHRATQNGGYVWVHESEMERLKGKLTPCAKISLSIRNVRGLREFGRVNLHKSP
ncbi:hypothetical protein F442_16721 [Phytophthora nicotianae P10297]|uniref:Uncharacterized protein n=1 Tax=Phytophthora nicotianae P10297 TaxID=1317064 RepID=W2YIY8_PHYNI|nr:hypothetical protein F442_16721 [Phytophthora nicotianae P10297]